MPKVIYDALSLTSKIHGTGEIIEMLGLEEVVWETVKGAHGYKQRLYWNCISIHYDGNDDMGVWLELTGQGCRAFETYGNGDYEALFREVLANPGEMKLTRLDVAYDDISDENNVGILDIMQLCDDTRDQSFISRFGEYQVIYGSKGNSINHGSMKSEIFVRIYDKAMERGFTDGRHWIRVEIQLRRDRALAFVKQPGSIGQKFAGVLLNYLRYIEQPEEADTNRWRWPMKCYWEQLIQSAEKIKLYEKPGTEYNLGNLDSLVFSQIGGAIHTALTIYGDDLFKEKLQYQRPAQLNPKYKRLLAEYGV